jgi:GrpB-like predicted nucleotidyltransferase (UPF0157 family)
LPVPVTIVDYDLAWPERFQAESARIMAATRGLIVTIEHFGSTSVPGLAAKPIIDLLAGVMALADADQAIAPIESLGYIYVPQYEDIFPERRYFRRTDGERPTHHLHVVEIGSDFWERHLRFRDLLRADPELAGRYAALKRELAARYGRDRVGYTDAKTEFIEAAMKEG